MISLDIFMKPVRVKVHDTCRKAMFISGRSRWGAVFGRGSSLIDAETDARSRRVRREVHDRLSERVCGELVQAGETFSGSAAGFVELFWRECVATARGMAAKVGFIRKIRGDGFNGIAATIRAPLPGDLRQIGVVAAVRRHVAQLKKHCAFAI